MGSLMGHVISGFPFFVIGIWHLLNHIKFHALHPNSYTSLAWFPTSKVKYLELYFIMTTSSIYIVLELFVNPHRHQPLNLDGTIPSSHLRHFEHFSMAMTFIINSALAIGVDKIGSKAKMGLSQLLAAIAFIQELLLFRLHSTDHTDLEGHYHFFLQMLVLVCLITSLMIIGHPKSFILSFIRSISMIFQGVWFTVIGLMLWTPEFMPKGCFMNLEDKHKVVRCHSDEALDRAKSLVNLEFSWYVIGMTLFSMSMYIVLIKKYGEKVEYRCLTIYEDQEEDQEMEDVEAQKKSNVH